MTYEDVLMTAFLVPIIIGLWMGIGLFIVGLIKEFF